MPDTVPAVQDVDHKQKVRSFFDESKQWHGDLYGSRDDYFSCVIRRRKDYAIEMLKGIPGLPHGKALDIGCGSGIYMEELVALGYEVTGVDISAEMLATCRKRFGMEENDSDRIHLRQGDVEHLPLLDHQFDLVICVGVFGYLLSDELAQAEIRRVLKPGGILLLNLTNMLSMSDADFVVRKKIRSLLGGKKAGENQEECPDYAIQSEWMMQHRKYFFKSYNLRKYERILDTKGFRRLDAMTYGFEFRILRKIPLIPKRWLDSVELALERLVRRRQIPYLSYSGWVYTGVFVRA
jgi:ubiquinone/menaquinone biosynthesis C-methylase UbiE